MLVRLALSFLLASLLLIKCEAAAGCTEDKVEVAIVGGGLSGLTAALALAKNGTCVMVIEAQSEVGGKVKNWDVGPIHDLSQPRKPLVATGVQVSVGGSHFNTALETSFLSLLDATGLTSLAYPPSNVSPFSLPPLVYPPALVSENPADYELFAELFGIGASYPIIQLAPQPIQELQSISVIEWLFKNQASATIGAINMVREFVFLEMSISPALVDAYYAAKYISEVVEFNGESFPLGATSALYFELIGGTGQLPQALFALLKSHGVIFQLNKKVTKITQTKSNVHIEVKGKSRKDKYTASSSAIVAIDPGLISKIDFVPALPTEIRRLTRTEASTKVVQYQVFAFFRSPWWYTIDASGPRSPIIVPSIDLYSVVASERKRPKLFGYAVSVPPLNVESARDLGVFRITVAAEDYKSTPKTLRADVLEYLAFFNITIPSSELLDVKTFDWGEVHTIRHGYFPIGSINKNLASTYLQVNQGTNNNRIFFASTECADSYNTLMEGAARSGYFAAAQAAAFAASS
jgi:monoamine oxidase